MDYKDYYATLAVKKTATADEIKRSYRKLARKYHPDVSKEPDAESRFKDLAEAYEVLGDAAKRAVYDDVGSRQQNSQEYRQPPGWEGGYEFDGRGDGGFPGSPGGGNHSDFFDAIFGRATSGGRGQRRPEPTVSGDHHAKVRIDLVDAYRGGHRNITLRVPQTDASGQTMLQDRTLDVNIPKGIRAGQHLRLAGQGSPAHGGEPAGDLYLEIEFAAHPHFRLEGIDVYVDLPVAPWEAALGAGIVVPTPDGDVQMKLPAGSASGRKLRLKGKGLPGTPTGDLYAVLAIALPPADNEASQEAYREMAKTFADFKPRHSLEGMNP
ncbi:DnaJ C-terminal domain-containing protein [uncultured Nevskia sp.]|uniref:DnaJ C-terminal domain-containing protein n=1 Tax=uncultured Nevskia sp. TaxID=228950 RepID=UPI0025D9AEE1|nr:DnaJ C-terminal domain-containing protein [uncultured Nevskia sp.]